MAETIDIMRDARGEWMGRLADRQEWLPLPFTAQASWDAVTDFYRRRGDTLRYVPADLAPHTARCLAAAMIAAIENIRDQEGIGWNGFREAMQRNDAYREAVGYLADGTKDCECMR